MKAGAFVKGLQFIIDRVGDGYILGAAHDIIYVYADRSRFTLDERQRLSDEFGIHSAVEGNGDDNPGGFYAFP